MDLSKWYTNVPSKIGQLPSSTAPPSTLSATTSSQIPKTSNKSSLKSKITKNKKENEEGFKIFVGNLSLDISDTDLLNAFSKEYPSVTKAQVARTGTNNFHFNIGTGNNKSRGYGFVTFANGKEYLKALKEMDGQFIGSKPVTIKKSEHNKSKYKKES